MNLNSKGVKSIDETPRDVIIERWEDFTGLKAVKIE